MLDGRAGISKAESFHFRQGHDSGIRGAEEWRRDTRVSVLAGKEWPVSQLTVGVFLTVCACLGGEGSKRIRDKCEKGKGKEGERRLS